MLAGNFIYALSQWGMITALAKLGSPEMVGEFVLALAITTPLALLASLQLRQVQATDLADCYPISQYLRIRAITATLTIFIAAGIVCTSNYAHSTRVVVLIVAISKSFEGMSDVIYGHFQRCERLDVVATSLILKGPLSLAAFTTALRLTGSLPWSTLALAGAFCAVALLYDVRKVANFTGKELKSSLVSFAHSLSPKRILEDTATLLALARTSAPLGFGNSVASLSALAPRYAVDHYAGHFALGIYGGIAYIQQAGNVVTNAIGQAVLPRLTHLKERGALRSFLGIQILVLALGAGLGLSAWALSVYQGTTILRLLYQPAYAGYTHVLQWQMLSCAVAMVASFATTGLTSMRQFPIQLPLMAAVTTVSCLGSVTLIPRLGLIGAPISTFCAQSLQATAALTIMAAILWRERSTNQSL